MITSFEEKTNKVPYGKFHFECPIPSEKNKFLLLLAKLFSSLMIGLSIIFFNGNFKP